MNEHLIWYAESMVTSDLYFSTRPHYSQDTYISLPIYLRLKFSGRRQKFSMKTLIRTCGSRKVQMKINTRVWPWYCFTGTLGHFLSRSAPKENLRGRPREFDGTHRWYIVCAANALASRIFESDARGEFEYTSVLCIISYNTQHSDIDSWKVVPNARRKGLGNLKLLQWTFTSTV